MKEVRETAVATGNWGENTAWELYDTAVMPPVDLCTAVMCVAIVDGRIVLARSERGWGLLGGHIEDGETPEAALYREALEEGGFTIDRYKLFAVRKITAKAQKTERPGKSYPFPTSYMTYYWATTREQLSASNGEEIIESGSFTLDEIAQLNTPDEQLAKLGWEAYVAHRAGLSRQ